jgi:hypothetical protein
MAGAYPGEPLSVVKSFFFFASRNLQVGELKELLLKKKEAGAGFV